MHLTAIENAKAFFETYLNVSNNEACKVIEIGSKDINGSLRSVCPSTVEYVGLDFEVGAGVDIVLDDPYFLPFDNETCDIVMSSSCFEHSEMFWVLFLEIMRVLKPSGLFYLNAPSSGSFHRFPVDCWRFYPDSGNAMIAWARRSGYTPVLLESYIQIGGNWQDFVSVFLKDDGNINLYPHRILDKKIDYENGIMHANKKLLNPRWISQNERKLIAINQISNETLLVK